MSQAGIKKTYELKRVGKHWLIGTTGKRFQRLPILASATEIVVSDNFLIVDEDKLYEIEENEEEKIILKKVEDASIAEEEHSRVEESENIDLQDGASCEQNICNGSKGNERVTPDFQINETKAAEPKRLYPVKIIHEVKTADQMKTKKQNLFDRTSHTQDEKLSKGELKMGHTHEIHESLEAGNTEKSNLNAGAAAFKTGHTVQRNADMLQEAKDLELFVEMQNIPAGETDSTLKSKIYDLRLPIVNPELIFCDGANTAIMICRSVQDASTLLEQKGMFKFKRLNKACLSGTTARLDARVWNIAKANNFISEIKDKLKYIHVTVTDESTLQVKANTLYQIKCAHAILARYDGQQSTGSSDVQRKKQKGNSFVVYENKEVLKNVPEQVWSIVKEKIIDEICVFEKDFGKILHSSKEETLTIPPFNGEIAKNVVKKIKRATEDLAKKEIMEIYVDFTKFDIGKIEDACKHVEEATQYSCCVLLKDKGRLLAYDESYEKFLNVKHQLLMKIGMFKPTARNRANRKAGNVPVFDNDEPLSLPQTFDQTEERPKPEGLFHPSDGGRNIEKYTINKIIVYVYKADILKLSVDCIVNAANKNLSHGGGEAYMLARAAGDSLKKEVDKYIAENTMLPVGQACTTTAGKLHYKCVVHTVGPSWSNYSPHTEADVRRCEDDLHYAIYSCFMEAEKKNMKKIAIPAVSTAIFGVPAEICVNQYARATVDYCMKPGGDPGALSEIHFIDMELHIVKQIQDIFNIIVREGRKTPYKRNDYVKQTTYRGQVSQKSQKQSTEPGAWKLPEPLVYEEGWKCNVFCFLPNNEVTICMGDISKEKTSGIVVSVNKEGQGEAVGVVVFNKMPVSYSLIVKSNLKKELKYMYSPAIGDVVVSDGYSCGFLKILFVVYPIEAQRKAHTQRRNDLMHAYGNVLKIASRDTKIQSVATTLFGIDFRLDRELKLGAEAFLSSYLAYCELMKEDKSALKLKIVCKTGHAHDVVCSVFNSYVQSQM